MLQILYYDIVYGHTLSQPDKQKQWTEKNVPTVVYRLICLLNSEFVFWLHFHHANISKTLQFQCKTI